MSENLLGHRHVYPVDIVGGHSYVAITKGHNYKCHERISAITILTCSGFRVMYIELATSYSSAGNDAPTPSRVYGQYIAVLKSCSRGNMVA